MDSSATRIPQNQRDFSPMARLRPTDALSAGLNLSVGGFLCFFCKACSRLQAAALMILLLQLPVLAQSSYPRYLVKARVDPLSQRIEGEVKIRPMPSSHFYLHADLSIHAISIDGRAVAFHRDSTLAQLQYNDSSFPASDKRAPWAGSNGILRRSTPPQRLVKGEPR